jgi:hypothetical protein
MSLYFCQNVFDKLETEGFIVPASKPAQSALCRDGGEGSYEESSKQSFVVYLTANMLV